MCMHGMAFFGCLYSPLSSCLFSILSLQGKVVGNICLFSCLCTHEKEITMNKILLSLTMIISNISF